MSEETFIKVESYSGGRADETPRRLVFTDRTVEVMEVEERQRTPEGESVRLRGDNGVAYTVQRSPRSGCWRLLAIDRPA